MKISFHRQASSRRIRIRATSEINQISVYAAVVSLFDSFHRRISMKKNWSSKLAAPVEANICPQQDQFFSSSPLSSNELNIIQSVMAQAFSQNQYIRRQRRIGWYTPAPACRRVVTLFFFFFFPPGRKTEQQLRESVITDPPSARKSLHYVERKPLRIAPISTAVEYVRQSKSDREAERLSKKAEASRVPDCRPGYDIHRSLQAGAGLPGCLASLCTIG